MFLELFTILRTCTHCRMTLKCPSGLDVEYRFLKKLIKNIFFFVFFLIQCCSVYNYFFFLLRFKTLIQEITKLAITAMAYFGKQIKKPKNKHHDSLAYFKNTLTF